MNENEQKQKDAKKKNFGLFFASSPCFLLYTFHNKDSGEFYNSCKRDEY